MPDIEFIYKQNNIADVLDNYAAPSEEYEEADNLTEYTNKPVYDTVKRVFDVAACLLASVVLFPFLLIIAGVILLDDHKGSPIFSQERCGKDGKIFKIYKFRTMCYDAEDRLKNFQEYNEMDGPVFKIKDDPRITRVGKFLRATGIDELPQIWNIIKGDMSIVGPRPALPGEVEQYDKKSKIRLKVLPGLTCYWQIEPKRNTVSFDDWMLLDRKYVADRGILVDIKIILKTFVTVIKMQGC